MLPDGGAAFDVSRGLAQILRRLSLARLPLPLLPILSSPVPVPVAVAREEDRSREACRIEANLATVLSFCFPYTSWKSGASITAALLSVRRLRAGLLLSVRGDGGWFASDSATAGVAVLS